MNLDHEGVEGLIEHMEKICDEIRYNALEFSFHTRGGATYEDVLNMSDGERKLINRMMEKHFENTKATKMPYF